MGCSSRYGNDPSESDRDSQRSESRHRNDDGSFLRQHTSPNGWTRPACLRPKLSSAGPRLSVRVPGGVIQLTRVSVRGPWQASIVVMSMACQLCVSVARQSPCFFTVFYFGGAISGEKGQNPPALSATASVAAKRGSPHWLSSYRSAHPSHAFCTSRSSGFSGNFSAGSLLEWLQMSRAHLMQARGLGRSY